MNCVSQANAEFINGFKQTFGTKKGLKGFAFGVAVITYVVSMMIGSIWLIGYLDFEWVGVGVALWVGMSSLIIISMAYIITVYEHCNKTDDGSNNKVGG